MKRLSRLAKWWLGLGLLFLLVLAGFEISHALYGSPASRERATGFDDKDIKAARAWATVHRCWLGKPLAPGEVVAERLRAITLATQPSDKPDAWPARCAPLIDAYLEAGRSEPATDVEIRQLRDSMLKGGPSMERGMSSFDFGFHRRAAALEPATEVAPAPEPVDPVVPFGADRVVALGDLVRREDGRLWSLQSRRSCVFSRDGKSLECAFLPDAVAAVVGDYASTSWEGFISARVPSKTGGPRQAGIASLSTGELVYAGWVQEVTPDASGQLFAISIGSAGEQLLVSSSKPKQPLLRLGRDAAFFFDGHLIEIGAQVRIRSLSDLKAAATDVSAPGALSGPVKPVCRSSTAAFARVGSGQILRHDKSGWSVLAAGADRATFTCEESSLAWAVSQDNQQLELGSCDAKGCSATQVTHGVAGRRGGIANCLNGNVISAFEARGAVQLVVAPLDEISKVVPKPLVATQHLADSFSSVERVDVHGVEGGALVIANVAGASVPIRVGCDGSVTRLSATLK